MALFSNLDIQQNFLQQLLGNRSELLDQRQQLLDQLGVPRDVPIPEPEKVGVGQGIGAAISDALSAYARGLGAPVQIGAVRELQKRRERSRERIERAQQQKAQAEDEATRRVAATRLGFLEQDIAEQRGLEAEQRELAQRRELARDERSFNLLMQKNEMDFRKDERIARETFDREIARLRASESKFDIAKAQDQINRRDAVSQELMARAPELIQQVTQGARTTADVVRELEGHLDIAYLDDATRGVVVELLNKHIVLPALRAERQRLDSANTGGVALSGFQPPQSPLQTEASLSQILMGNPFISPPRR